MRFVFVLLALACASCGRDPTDAPPRWTPSAADLRFKGVGGPTIALPALVSGLSELVLVHYNRFGTPLVISPCTPPSPAAPSCYWPYTAFDVPDVNTVYYGIGSLPTLDTDLEALQRWALGLDPDVNSVITSLMIDEPSGTYYTSGIQTSQMREFDLAWDSLPSSALQAAASQAGANGRVITALAFNAGSVVYLSYGWQRDRSTVYEVKVAPATFGSIPREAASLAREGYVITALGGNSTRGLLLVGTRARGATTPRALEIATDSIFLPNSPPAVRLAQDGYAIVGGIFVEHGTSSRGFNMYVGEK